MSSPNILVTGASGQLGHRVVALLLEAKAGNIIAASRDVSKLADLAAKGAQTRRLDFDDEASLKDGFAGVDRVLIVSTDALDVPGKRLEQHLRAVKAAQAAGVSYLAYTSLLNCVPGALITFAPDHYGTEAAIKATGIDYAILRNGWYMDNLLMAAPQAVASSTWFASSGEGRTAHVSREDCARAAVGALLKTPKKVTFSITGPESFSISEIADLTAKIAEKPITLVTLTDEQLKGGLKQAGLPEALVDALVSYESSVRAGQLATVTNDVETLSGRPAQTLEAFLSAHKAILG